MKAGKIKHKLANKLLDLFGKGWSIDPNDLSVNRGATHFNDWCSWTGYIFSPENRRLQIHSWSTMSELIHAEKIGLVNKIDFIGGTEISH